MFSLILIMINVVLDRMVGYFMVLKQANECCKIAQKFARKRKKNSLNLIVF